MIINKTIDKIMKTLNLLLKALATYVAGKCFRKMMEKKEILEEEFIKLIENNKENVFLHVWQIGLDRDIQKKTLFGEGKEIYIRNFIEKINKKKNSDLYQRNFRIVKYLLNKELNLCSLEMIEKIYVSMENPIVYFNQFQWVEQTTKLTNQKQ